MSNAGSITFLNDLSGWQLSSSTIAMRQEPQPGTPGGENRKSCEGGASHAFRRRGLRSPYTLKCIHLALGHSLSYTQNETTPPKKMRGKKWKIVYLNSRVLSRGL